MARDGIQKRGNSYRAQVRLQGFPAQTATFARRTDAKEWVEKTKTAIRDGRHFETREAQRRTLGDLVDRRLEAIKIKRPHAYANERVILNWWKDQLGQYALVHIGPDRIAEKRDALRAENIGTEAEPQHRSPATVNRYLAALSKAYSEALREWHWVTRNPVRNVTKETEPTGRVRYLSEPERVRLLAACAKSSLPELRTIVMLALTTGMRRSEILWLRWPDVDLARAMAVLHKTKNRERRGVALVPQVVEFLRVHGQVRRLDTDLVFPREGKKIPVAFDKPFIAAVKAAGLEDFRFHDLRHTAASYLAMSGATTAEIAAVLGHKTLAMVKRYAHLSDAHTAAVVNRMNDKFFGT